MKIEAAILISGIAMAFGVYSGIFNIRRRSREDNRKESAELTMVIVKLEGISAGIAEIKTDLSNAKGDIKEMTERVIVAEQAIKSAHSRLDSLHRE